MTSLFEKENYFARTEKTVLAQLLLGEHKEEIEGGSRKRKEQHNKKLKTKIQIYTQKNIFYKQYYKEFNENQ